MTAYSAFHDCLNEKRIPLGDLKPGYLYIIHARNGRVGVYRHNPDANDPQWRHEYDLPRTKFGRTYVDQEYDWETGPPFGTAIPLKEVGPVPENVEDLLAYLVAEQERLTPEHEALTKDAWAAWRRGR